MLIRFKSFPKSILILADIIWYGIIVFAVLGTLGIILFYLSGQFPEGIKVSVHAITSSIPLQHIEGYIKLTPVTPGMIILIIFGALLIYAPVAYAAYSFREFLISPVPVKLPQLLIRVGTALLIVEPIRFIGNIVFYYNYIEDLKMKDITLLPDIDLNAPFLLVSLLILVIGIVIGNIMFIENQSEPKIEDPTE